MTISPLTLTCSPRPTARDEFDMITALTHSDRQPDKSVLQINTLIYSHKIHKQTELPIT